MDLGDELIASRISTAELQGRTQAMARDRYDLRYKQQIDYGGRSKSHAIAATEQFALAREARLGQRMATSAN